MSYNNTNQRPSGEGNNMTGRFGSSGERSITPAVGERGRERSTGRRVGFEGFGTAMTVQQWVDIICIAVLVIGIGLVLINWETVLDALFVHMLFPLISVGAAVVLAIVVIAILLFALYARLSRPRRWF